MPTAPIPDYSKVGLLLPMSGANNGVTFADHSPAAATVSVFGNAKTVTAQSQYYGSSAAFDGTGDYLTVPHGSNLSAGGAGLCVGGYIRPTVVNSIRTVATKRPVSGTNTEWALITNADGTLSFVAWDAAGALVCNVTSSVSLTAAAWQHVEADVLTPTVTGSQVFLFIGGVLRGSGALSAAVGTNSQPVYVGRDPTNTGRDFNGYMQDIIIAGSTLHTATFTPPTRLIGDISIETRDELGALAPRKYFAVPRTYPSIVKASGITNGAGVATVSGVPACEYSVVVLPEGDTLPDLVLRRLAA